MANFNLDVAFNFAQEKFQQNTAELMAQNSGGQYNAEDSTITIEYLGDLYKVSYPDGQAVFVDREGEVDLKVKVLLMHYLAEASGVPLTGHKISFKEVPGGDIYIVPFSNRAVNPFVRMFGENGEAFKKVAERMGGVPDKMGDICYTIPVFPRVPVTFVLWLGDDEFPASGTILFDSSATRYLPTEDFAVISQFAVFKMKALLEII